MNTLVYPWPTLMAFVLAYWNILILVIQVEAALTVLRVSWTEKVCWAVADDIAMCVRKNHLLNWKDHPK